MKRGDNMDLHKVFLKDNVDIDEDITFNEDLSNSGVKSINNTHVSGNIHRNTEDEYEINLHAIGTMVVEDAITLEPINYPFDVEIDEIETLENHQNYLDIMELLWQNIVLEIPSRVTNVKDLSSYHGDGWKVIDEEDKETTYNPFQELKEKLEEE